jgi:copper transport protein
VPRFRRPWPILTVLIATLALVLALLPYAGSAHAFLAASDPAANAVLPTAPAQAVLTFTEPVEPESSRVELYDAGGAPVPGTESHLGIDAFHLVMELPTDLPNGTYTISYRNISAADGHPVSGYIPFTIGSEADIVAPAAPARTNFDLPPAWLDGFARWLSVLGLIGALGALVCWRVVIAPSLAPLDPADVSRLGRRTRRFALICAGAGAIGDLVLLVVQAGYADSLFAISGLRQELQDTRYGHVWFARIGLLVAFAAGLALSSVWRRKPPRWVDIPVFALGGVALLPLALVSHASGETVGRGTAVASDWLHLVAASVWIGGLLALLVTLIYGLRRTPSTDRREVYALAIPRFSVLAISSVVILSLTGFYSAWLQVGNLTALLHTSYGHVLLVKLGLIATMLVLGLINQRVLGPRMRTAARAGRGFGRTIAAEAMLGVGILCAVAILSSQPTGREALAAASGNSTFHWSHDGTHAVLFISPSAVGANRYTLDAATDAGDLPGDTVALVRVSHAGDVEGTIDVPLERVGPQRFEASGSELSIAGPWQVELIIRQPNTADWRNTALMTVGFEPASATLPGVPPRFPSLAATGAVLLIGLAVVVIVAGWHFGRSRRDRRDFVGIGAGLLIAGVAILLFSRVSHTASAATPNPVGLSSASVEAGRQLYGADCEACHGADGNGAGATITDSSLDPPSLTRGEVDTYTDGDLFWWIRHGDGQMPPAPYDLSDIDIWNIVNYVRTLRHPLEGGAH